MAGRVTDVSASWTQIWLTASESRSRCCGQTDITVEIARFAHEDRHCETNRRWLLDHHRSRECRILSVSDLSFLSRIGSKPDTSKQASHEGTPPDAESRTQISGYPPVGGVDTSVLPPATAPCFFADAQEPVPFLESTAFSPQKAYRSSSRPLVTRWYQQESYPPTLL